MERIDFDDEADRAKERRGSLFWVFWLVGLIVWQGWMTLSLFGPPEVARERLLSDEPILSGKHPLHLYHGWLESQALLLRGTVICPDPAFQAGYPKTPVFDAGSRPGGLAQLIAGGVYQPMAYKLALAVTCLLMPFLLIIACWGVGLNRSTSALATTAGLLVCWSEANRTAIELGETDLLLAGLATLAHVGLLVRFHKQPGLLGWLGLVVTGTVAWFAQPILLVLLLPLLCVYYLSVGPRHGELAWHVGLIASEVAGVVTNLIWLVDYGKHWWVRLPLEQAVDLLQHRTFRTLWEAALWGPQMDKQLAVLLLVSAIFGIMIFNQSYERIAARLLGLGTIALGMLAVLGIAWEPLGGYGTAGLLGPALCFAALPAAYAWTRTYDLLAWMTGRKRFAFCLMVAAVGAAGAWRHTEVLALAERCQRAEPLVVGLDASQRSLLETIRQYTSPEARILLEDFPSAKERSRWTALLPVLTERAYIGGLDGDLVIEHSQISLIDGMLAGKPLAQWSDAALEAYCRRYNVAWVIARNPATVERLQKWEGATELVTLQSIKPRAIFEVPRPAKSFALKGHAELTHSDSQFITLENVTPEDGVVLLSLHYHEGLRVYPDRVTLEPEFDPSDPIPLVRLRLHSKVALVTLRWGE